ncbi:hypothetical protein [Niveispirillum fermenti]|uniref:hypothetical protein n=1 Tax=Niveispirillum fermenti TaxID=1233113 RepID=UPI003A8AC5E2
MAISGVSAYSSVFQTPGVRPADTARVQPVPPAEQEAQQAATTQQENQQTNTNPTDNERQEALTAGRTRGSFVNITA